MSVLVIKEGVDHRSLNACTLSKIFKSPREEPQLKKPMSTEEELMPLKMPHFNIFQLHQKKTGMKIVQVIKQCQMQFTIF